VLIGQESLIRSNPSSFDTPTNKNKNKPAPTKHQLVRRIAGQSCSGVTGVKQIEIYREITKEKMSSSEVFRSPLGKRKEKRRWELLLLLAFIELVVLVCTCQSRTIITIYEANPDNNGKLREICRCSHRKRVISRKKIHHSLCVDSTWLRSLIQQQTSNFAVLLTTSTNSCDVYWAISVGYVIDYPYCSCCSSCWLHFHSSPFRMIGLVIILSIMLMLLHTYSLRFKAWVGGYKVSHNFCHSSSVMHYSL